MELLNFCAPCLFGLEGIVADELRRMGAATVTPQNGRVLFSGEPALLARANIGSRCAERIQLQLGAFPATSFDALFEGVRALPWERFIRPKDAFPVKGWSLNSALHSVPDCQAIVKKAIVERLKAHYGIGWFEETGATVQVQFTLLKDEATLLIDTSGPGLHKRGYRRNAGGAPLKETLAAAIVDVTRTRFAQRVIDPCCGSGTLLIEAALAARRVAPGVRRRFAAMNTEWLPASVWQEERQKALQNQLPEKAFAGFGYDIDPEMVALAAENAAKAGVGPLIRTARRELADFVPEGESGTVLCNPPYGERLLDVKTAQGLYRTMGRVFVPKPGWSYAIISPDEDFETHFGRKADKRRKLYNGMLKCQLYVYYK